MAQVEARQNGGTSAAFIGRHAIVVGAGVAGLAAAGALSAYFERVTVLERDGAFSGTVPRSGASQGWHAHGLLVGGQLALSELYPGIGQDFLAAGAVPMRVNQDLREEYPGRDPMPQRDFGLHGYTMTRPLIESTLRRRALQRGNIVICQNSAVRQLEVDRNGRVSAVYRTRQWTVTPSRNCPQTSWSMHRVAANSRSTCCNRLATHSRAKRRLASTFATARRSCLCRRMH